MKLNTIMFLALASSYSGSLADCVCDLNISCLYHNCARKDKN